MKNKLATIALAILSLVTLSTSVQAQDGKVYECEGKSITTEGKRICNYTGADDKLVRNVFATIRQDSIIYSVVRTNPDGSMNKLIKYHLFIGDIAMDAGTTSRAFGSWNEGDKKNYRLDFKVLGGKQLNWYEEMICSSKQYGLYRKQVLEMSFDSEADSKEFFAKVQAVHAALPPKESAGSGDTKKVDEKGPEFVYVSFYNDMGSDVYIKKEMDPQFYHLDNKASQSLLCKPGQKMYWGEKGSGTTKGLIFVITEQMLKDKTVKLSTGTKK